MVWWWLGNVVFLFVVIPAVVLLLQALLRVTREIHAYAHDALEHGQGLVSGLDGLQQLDQTRDQAGNVGSGVRRYAAALEQIM